MSKKSSTFLVVKSLLFSMILFFISSFYFCLSKLEGINSLGSLIKKNLKFMFNSPKHALSGYENNNVKFTLDKTIDDLNFKIYEVNYN